MKIVNEILTKGLMSHGFKVEVKYLNNGELVTVTANDGQDQWRMSQRVKEADGHNAQLRARERALFVILLKLAKIYGPPFMKDFLTREWSLSELEFVMGPFRFNDPDYISSFLKAKNRARILLQGGAA